MSVGPSQLLLSGAFMPPTTLVSAPAFVSSGVSPPTTSPHHHHHLPPPLSPARSLPGIRKPGWQADGTDEDGRDWLIPNLLSPCHSGPQRREGNKRKRRKERERVMEPARWSQLSDGESFMVLRTQQLHRARLHGSALLSIFLVGSRCRPSCVYPGFVLPPHTHTRLLHLHFLLQHSVIPTPVSSSPPRMDAVKNRSTPPEFCPGAS